MEPRAAIGAFDKASGRFTLHSGCQGVFGMKGQLADVLGVTPDKVRVLTGNVGGSFGMKAAVYPGICLRRCMRRARSAGR